jgi:hypothetical protein
MMAVMSVQTTFASHACQATSSVKTISAINVELTKMDVTSVTTSILVRNAQTRDLFSQEILTNVSVILAKDLRRTQSLKSVNVGILHTMWFQMTRQEFAPDAQNYIQIVLSVCNQPQQQLVPLDI